MPVHTYRLALRLAFKYNMEDIQKKIVDTFNNQIGKSLQMGDQRVALEQVGLMGEFPGQFKRSMVARVLTSVQFAGLTATSLIPLQGSLDIVAALLNWYSFRARGSLNMNFDQYIKGCGFIDG